MQLVNSFFNEGKEQAMMAKLDSRIDHRRSRPSATTRETD
jgi:hypothetical protein